MTKLHVQTGALLLLVLLVGYLLVTGALVPAELWGLLESLVAFFTSP